MSSGILVDPVFLGKGHAFAPRHFSFGFRLVKGAAFRSVAKRLEPVAFPGRVPSERITAALTTPRKTLKRLHRCKTQLSGP